LSKAIEAIMKESLKQSLYQNAVDEKEKQQKMLGEEDDDLFGGDDEGEEKKDDKETSDSGSSKTTDAEKDKLKKGEIETKDIVDKLNTIRSGKSFKDESISAHLDEYVKSLSKAEKVALLAFLKGLAQIVTGEIPAADATNPADPDPDVEMKKGDKEEKKTKSIKPNVIKAPEKEKSEKKPSSEDTSGPVPITPKKK
jgi:hypothetical protein